MLVAKFRRDLGAFCIGFKLVLQTRPSTWKQTLEALNFVDGEKFANKSYLEVDGKNLEKRIPVITLCLFPYAADVGPPAGPLLREGGGQIRRFELRFRPRPSSVGDEFFKK